MVLRAALAHDFIDAHRLRWEQLALDIWHYAELALHEERSSLRLQEELKKEGFTIETGIGGMPTAFVATWGSGRPIIGFLGEFDALAGLSQKPVPYREPLQEGAPGHGCGHNLLGTAPLAAVLALKTQMEAQGLPGTIQYFGCPAEENLSGKAFMARDGAFTHLDAALTWHPGAITRVQTGSSSANNAANFIFRGRSAHAAGDPQNGRSALDAVQLMNMGVEFLREHIPPTARIHYVISHGGDQPNVVPPYAKVWYLVRGVDRQEVDHVWERVMACARGAAEMTETTFEVEWLKAIHNFLPNDPLIDLLEEVIFRVGGPSFDAEDYTFAEELARSISPQQRKSALQNLQLEGQVSDETLLLDKPFPRPPLPPQGRGSTDVAEVSWSCPTAQFWATTQILGTPGHSWQVVAQSGSSIGLKGMKAAAHILAEAGYELFTNPEVLRKAKEDFLKRTGGKPFKSALPEGLKPAFHQFADA
ncbi:MAG: amidohydrolase [Clostridiales bacterium]|nr:amidohydrolase [Clostridiales bacterium]